MDTIENCIGSDTYYTLKNFFTKQVNSKECIVCPNYKLNDISNICAMRYSHLVFSLNNGFIEEEFAINTKECSESFIKYEQSITISNNNTISNMNNVIDDTLNIKNNTQMELDTQLSNINNTLQINDGIPISSIENNEFDNQFYSRINYGNCFETTISFINNANNHTLNTNEISVNIMAGYNQFNMLNIYFDPYVDEHYWNN
ncbi:hypothetical protein QTN25_000244 [Entamoeba marina]